MQQERRACVLVMENDRLEGIFTERDILMKVAGQPLDLIHTSVSASMTPDPFTLPADANVAFRAQQDGARGLPHIPLVDDEGYPTAVVSMRNLIEYLGEIYSRELLTMLPNRISTASRAAKAPDQSSSTLQPLKHFRALALLLTLGLVLDGLSGCGVNKIPTLDEQVKAAWSEVLNQYQRRADLIPSWSKPSRAMRTRSSRC